MIFINSKMSKVNKSSDRDFQTGDISDKNAQYIFKDEKSFIQREISIIDMRLRQILVLVEQLLDTDVDNLNNHIEQLES
jgi:hypothetical protein